MNIPQLKGFIAEEIAKYHFHKLQYNVVPIGREKIEPELSDLLLFIRGNMAHLNNQSANSFKLFENTISKLPDYAIWKIAPQNQENMMTFRFVEVKYRTNVINLKHHKTKDIYYLNITEKDDQNELLVHKYINNLQNLYGISNTNVKENKIDNIDFYIYLITIIDGKHTPLIGKVLSSSYSDFYVYLYTPEQLKKATNLLNLWGKDYQTVSKYFMKNDKLEQIFSDEFLVPLIGKSDSEIIDSVVSYIEKGNIK